LGKSENFKGVEKVPGFPSPFPPFFVKALDFQGFHNFNRNFHSPVQACTGLFSSLYRLHNYFLLNFFREFHDFFTARLSGRSRPPSRRR